MTKLALLVGINYENTQHELRGCIHDVVSTKKMLSTKLGYQDIVLMTDHTEKRPTRDNILKALITLTQRSYDEDVHEIWISYAGHGAYKMDDDQDEDDHKDEDKDEYEDEDDGDRDGDEDGDDEDEDD